MVCDGAIRLSSGRRTQDGSSGWATQHTLSSRLPATALSRRRRMPYLSQSVCASQANKMSTGQPKCTINFGGSLWIRILTAVITDMHRFERTSLLQQAGFVNRDELHHANLTEISSSVDAGSVDVGFFKQGKWVWGHNPEKYATENYAPCLAHLQNGAAFRNTNLPPGHIFHLWTMESENKRMAAGIPSDLKSNGYWGV